MFALCPPLGGPAPPCVPGPSCLVLHLACSQVHAHARTGRCSCAQGAGRHCLSPAVPLLPILGETAPQPGPMGKGLLSLAREEGLLWFGSVVRVCEWSPGMDVLSSCWSEACEGGRGVEGLCP